VPLLRVERRAKEHRTEHAAAESGGCDQGRVGKSRALLRRIPNWESFLTLRSDPHWPELKNPNDVCMNVE
jgi:hypothetical protein